MKKSSIILGIVVLLVCIYCCADGAPSVATKGDNMQITTIIENGGCLECHTAEPKLPFYAELPLAGDVVKKDIEEGYRSFDIQPMYDALKEGKKISEVDLAKVEKVASRLYKECLVKGLPVEYSDKSWELEKDYEDIHLEMIHPYTFAEETRILKFKQPYTIFIHNNIYITKFEL